MKKRVATPTRREKEEDVLSEEEKVRRAKRKYCEYCRRVRRSADPFGAVVLMQACEDFSVAEELGIDREKCR